MDPGRRSTNGDRNVGVRSPIRASTMPFMMAQCEVVERDVMAGIDWMCGVDGWDPEHHVRHRARLPNVKEYDVRLRVVIQFDLGRGRASGRTL